MANNKVKFLRGTAAEYQALTVKDPDTLYVITDESENSDIINDTLISQTTTWSSQKIHDSLNGAVNEAKTYADGLAENTAAKNHTHTVSEITDFPESLPANGGNADTVNNHTVEADVPASAKFTDTVYTHPTYTARTGVPTANQTPAFGGTFAVTQPVSDATGHITAMNSRNITIPSTPASTSAAGLVSTDTQTFAGQKTFNGSILASGAGTVTTAQARNIYAGTSDMTAGTTALTTGTIYLVYE